jgi:hypothetical protein
VLDVIAHRCQISLHAGSSSSVLLCCCQLAAQLCGLLVSLLQLLLQADHLLAVCLRGSQLLLQLSDLLGSSIRLAPAAHGAQARQARQSVFVLIATSVAAAQSYLFDAGNTNGMLHWLQGDALLSHRHSFKARQDAVAELAPSTLNFLPISCLSWSAHLQQPLVHYACAYIQLMQH